MLNNSINLLLNQIIDSKIESNFKPIVLEMAKSLTTNQSKKKKYKFDYRNTLNPSAAL